MKTYDTTNGSPFDRGSADCYYGRPLVPHYWPEGTYNGEMVTELTNEEVEAYHAAYADQELSGEKKVW